MNINELDAGQSAWMLEVSQDLGISMANGILLKQINARLSAECERLKTEHEAMRAKLELTLAEFADVRDQLRGQRLPRATDRPNKKAK